LADWSTRSGTEHDIDAVLALWSSAGAAPGATDTRAALEGLLLRDPAGLLLAECEGALTGSLIAVWDGWRGNMYRLTVRGERRREGIATALVQEGERRLQRRGASRLSAIVSSDDPVAPRFWRAAGYEQQAERTRFVRLLER
jgi:ribosomal protein S18 acetylase RimI-like enzyme